MISQIEFSNLRAWFDSVDLYVLITSFVFFNPSSSNRDKSGSVEAHELANLSFDGVPLGIHAAFRLIKVFDKDRNGRIDFWEYCTLHKFVLTIRNAFLIADTDRSGRLAAQEIYTAITQSGFSYLSYNTLMEYLQKYDPQRIGLAWQDFLMLAAQIAHTRSIFEWNDTDRDGVVHFTLDQLNQVVAFLS